MQLIIGTNFEITIIVIMNNLISFFFYLIKLIKNVMLI